MSVRPNALLVDDRNRIAYGDVEFNRGPVREHGIIFFACPKESIQKEGHRETLLRYAESPALLASLGARLTRAYR